MPQQAGDVHKSALTSASSWKQYAAGGPYDLVADSPDGKRCACAVYFLNAGGNLTHCLLADGVTDRPVTGAPAGYQHSGNFTSDHAHGRRGRVLALSALTDLLLTAAIHRSCQQSRVAPSGEGARLASIH